MEEILTSMAIGLFFGTFGTTIGGIIGACIKTKSNKFLSFILEFAAGLMIAIVCFELIPDAMEISNIAIVIMGLISGVGIMMICDHLINYKYEKVTKKNTNSLLKTGIIVGIGLAIHNFPEGLAIGSGFEASIKLGVALAIAICLHDIPEGISMAVPMKSGGMKTSKVIIYTLLSGVTTGIGALFGSIIGTVSAELISICLAFAAGAMIYIVSGELIPESKKIYRGRLASVGNIIGFILGIISMQI